MVCKQPVDDCVAVPGQFALAITSIEQDLQQAWLSPTPQKPGRGRCQCNEARQEQQPVRPPPRNSSGLRSGCRWLRPGHGREDFETHVRRRHADDIKRRSEGERTLHVHKAIAVPGPHQGNTLLSQCHRELLGKFRGRE